MNEIYVKVSGQQRKVKEAYVKVSGTWRKAVPWRKISNTWREFKFGWGDVYIYTASLDGTVRKINPNGNEVWRFSASNEEFWSVAVDSNGYVYCISRNTSTGSYILRKLNPNGGQVWQFTGHTNIIRDVVVDANSYVYTGSNDRTVRKIDPNGKQVWSFTGHTSVVSGVAVDASGNVYSCSLDRTAKKIDPNGNEILTINTAGSCNKITVDQHGNIYLAVDSSSGNSGYVYKYGPNGNYVWSFRGDRYILDVAVDRDGYVYAGTYDNYLIKINPNGNQVWKYTGHTSTVNGVAVDVNGYVYSCSSSYGDRTVRKIDPNGKTVWVFSGHTDGVYDIEVDTGTYGAFPDYW